MMTETLTASEAEWTNMAIHGKVHQHHGTLGLHRQPETCRKVNTVQKNPSCEL